MEKSKNIGIWIRVSTEDQARGDSPEHHEKRARLYAESKEWNVVEIYHLEAVSGKSVKEHFEAKRMLRDIASGHITGIIFSKLARLARNTKELLEFADIFREHTADLISLQEAIDTSSPAGRLFYTMIAAMAQWEREEISDRVAASVPIRAQLGKSTGGAAPFGFQWENKQMVVDESEAPVRKLMYDIFLHTKRKKTTARELNTMGYRTRGGKPFTGLAIGRLLRDTTAKGVRIANYTKSVGNGNWEYKPQEDWVTVPCPKIVEEEIWEECNRILEQQYKKNRVTGPKTVHLLAGYIECSCGTKMYVYHKTSYICQKCKNRIAVEDIDSIYHEQLKVFLLSDVDLQTFKENSDTELKEKENLLESVIEKAAQQRKRMEELVNMRINRELTPENFKVHYKPIEEQVQQLENQIPELQAEIDIRKVQYHSSEIVLNEAKNLYEKWLSLSPQERRTIVETITERIIIDKEDIHISLTYLPTTHPSLNSVKGNQTPLGFNPM